MANEPLDAEYLLMLKRIRWKPVPRWVEDKAISDLRFMIGHRKQIADAADGALRRLSDDYARRFDGK